MSLKVAAPKSPEKNYQDYQQSFLFKSLVRMLGFTAAQSVISYVCASTGTPKTEFFSSYEIFSTLITQVYGEAGQKQVLDKFPNIKELTP